MNKTAKIIIGILIVVCGFFIVFAQIKAGEADKLNREAMNLVEKNKELKSNAKKQAQRAEEQAVMAIVAENRATKAIQQLEECQGSK